MADNTSDVSFAVGSVYCQGSYDLAAAIQAADEQMYQDKKAYYENHWFLSKFTIKRKEI